MHALNKSLSRATTKCALISDVRLITRQYSICDCDVLILQEDVDSEKIRIFNQINTLPSEMIVRE